MSSLHSRPRRIHVFAIFFLFLSHSHTSLFLCMCVSLSTPVSLCLCLHLSVSIYISLKITLLSFSISQCIFVRIFFLSLSFYSLSLSSLSSSHFFYEDVQFKEAIYLLDLVFSLKVVTGDANGMVNERSKVRSDMVRRVSRPSYDNELFSTSCSTIRFLVCFISDQANCA